MQRTRPTSSISQIHSLAAPVRSASWLRSGISVSSSDSTSRDVSSVSPSSACSSPSTRTDGRESDDRYSVDAPRAAARRSSRSNPAIVGSENGGGAYSDRIGLRAIGSTTAGSTFALRAPADTGAARGVSTTASGGGGGAGGSAFALRAPADTGACATTRTGGTSVRGGGTSVRGCGTSARGGGTSARGGGTSTRGGGTSTRGGGTSARGAGGMISVTDGDAFQA